MAFDAERQIPPPEMPPPPSPDSVPLQIGPSWTQRSGLAVAVAVGALFAIGVIVTVMLIFTRIIQLAT